jgi:DNA-binding XRE family transcriptional regulator
MNILETDKVPAPGESLAEFVRRLRIGQGLNQKELATKAGIHLQSLGKMERGKTAKLNHKTKNGLAYALGVPTEYLEATSKGISVEGMSTLQFCPQCWLPGTAPDPLWMSTRAKFCFACGNELSCRCRSCNELILSLKHRFCPFCGTAYKSTQNKKEKS